MALTSHMSFKRVISPTSTPCPTSVPRPVLDRRSGIKLQPLLRPLANRALQPLRAAATDAIELALPAAEILQTVKITQREDGKFIIEDIIPDSTADKKSIKKGSVVTAISDPVKPTEMWPLEARSSLSHVLDQMRLQQSSTIKLEILPPSAAEEASTGRTGFDKGSAGAQGEAGTSWRQRMDDSTFARRQQQREEYLSKEGTTNPTSWIGLAVGFVLAPAALILLYAIQSGFLDEMNAGWRSGM